MSRAIARYILKHVLKQTEGVCESCSMKHFGCVAIFSYFTVNIYRPCVCASVKYFKGWRGGWMWLHSQDHPGCRWTCRFALCCKGVDYMYYVGDNRGVGIRIYFRNTNTINSCDSFVTCILCIFIHGCHKWSSPSSSSSSTSSLYFDTLIIDV